MDDLTIGSFCTGYGGLDEAVRWVFGGRLAWWSDIEPGPIAVMSRHHPGLPNIGDVKTADWAEVEPVDILTAGYPCQPFSNAGKRLGVEDPRHIWPWIADAIGVLRPRVVVLENVAAHLRRGFDIVSADLASLGYDIRWTLVRASDVGAPHQRKRLFIVAHLADAEGAEWRDAEYEGVATSVGSAAESRERIGEDSGIVADANGEGPQGTESTRGCDVSARCAPANANGDGRVTRRPCDPAEGARGRESDRGAVDFGKYQPAVDRWTAILGRPAPAPTTTGARGGNVLSPHFVEWMMGLPAGHVTDTPGLTRAQMLRLLGNGVVPQQAEHALKLLLQSTDDAREEVA